MRRLTALQQEEQRLFDLVWYDRKLVMLDNIMAGIEALPDEDLMDQVTAQMRLVEEKYGKENLGPHSEFDWGMINGKLSALRWVLGDDWDMLDT